LRNGLDDGGVGVQRLLVADRLDPTLDDDGAADVVGVEERHERLAASSLWRLAALANARRSRRR
jgi:hypothetical protein